MYFIYIFNDSMCILIYKKKFQRNSNLLKNIL